MSPTPTQRIENGLLAVAILVAFVVADAGWWWPLVAFLAFDLSALGYLAGRRVGAAAYNAVHSYIGPAGLVIAGLVLGYGLKLVDGFTHTHLGRIGKDRHVAS